MTQDKEGYRWESHAEGGVKFELPSIWTTHDGEKSKVVGSPEGVKIEFRYFTLGAVEALHDEKMLTKELESMVTDIKFTNGPAKFTQHGLAGFGAGGTGQRQGVEIIWLLYTLGDRAGHGVLGFGFGTHAAWASRVPDIMHIMGSIQPINPPAS